MKGQIMDDYQKLYKERIFANRNNKNFFLKQIEEVKKQIETLSSIKRDMAKIIELQGRLRDYRYSLYIIDKEFEFLRPNTHEDIDYRRRIYSSDFYDVFREVIPADILLRFHGTQIYFAKDIIESGEISCSQDRFGYSTSCDADGCISVTTKDNIGVTLWGYCGLEVTTSMPMGCVFVLSPKGDDAIVYGDQMKKVDFKKDPDALYAVLTSPENMEMVRSWCTESGVDADKVCEFYAFLEKFKPRKEYSNRPIG